MSLALRDRVSIQVVQPLRRLYRRARPSLRGAVLAAAEGRRMRERSAAWSSDQRREWVLARLREVVRRAWWTTPYYRGVLDELGFDPRADFTFDDFAALPVLERDDVHRAGPGLVAATVPRSD